MEVVRRLPQTVLPNGPSLELIERFNRLVALLETNPDEAVALGEATSTTALSEAQPALAAQAGFVIGQAYLKLGDFERALPPLLAAVEQFEALQLFALQLEALTQLGQVYRNRAEFDAAMAALQRALALARSLQDATTAAQALNTMAGIYHAKGESPQALECLSEALAIRRQRHDYLAQAECLSNIGVLYIDQADYPKALECLLEARGLLRDHASSPRQEGNCLINIGYVYDDMRDYAQAASIYSEALSLARHHRDRLIEAMASVNLGVSQRQLGELSAALELFHAALHNAREIGLRIVEIAALDGIGTVRTALEQPEEALSAHRAALELARETSHREQEIEALMNLARAHLRFQHPALALEALNAALPLAETAELQKFVIEIHELLATAHEHLGNLTATIMHLRTHHQLERALFSAEAERRSKHLKMSFELERANNENEVMRRTNELLESKVARRTAELEEARIEVVTRLAAAAEYRDDSTGQHTTRVGTIAARIAEHMGMRLEEVELLRLAARLHDVGKIGISDSLLLKPAKLTSEELERVKEHAAIGAQILSGGKTPLLQMAEIVALSHHERWDGTGYPQGLQADAIPLLGRIVAIADVYDALMHTRPYKAAWSQQEAKKEIERQSGTQFDPRVVQAFLEVMRQLEAEPEL